MKLSVIVLTYNQEKTIAQTLDSILTQVHSYDYEILVGDDASKDNTPKIIEEYATKFPDIIKPVLRKQNLGIVKNYFDLVKASEGEYIMGCAGDDYWLPGKVDIQLDYMERHPECSMLYTQANVFDTTSQQFVDPFLGNPDNALEKLLLTNHVPAVTIAYRRTLKDSFMSETDRIREKWEMEDYPLVLFAAGNNALHILPKITAVYNISTTSITGGQDKERRFRFENNTYLIRKYFADYFNVSKKIRAEINCRHWIHTQQAKKTGIEISEVKKLTMHDVLFAQPKTAVKSILTIIYSLLKHLPIL